MAIKEIIHFKDEMDKNNHTKIWEDVLKSNYQSLEMPKNKEKGLKGNMGKLRNKSERKKSKNLRYLIERVTRA